jgi:NAD(P)-dependent dehydrogenase (short-subunit alcohol dehydrogenase family)
VDRLREKVVVITGAASGIGLAMAQAFGAEGMHVVASDVDDARLQTEVARLAASGVEIVATHCDTSSEEEVESLAQFALDAYGAAHVLCNNAGIAGLADPWSGSMDVWHRVVGINLYGVVHGIRSFLPIMQRQSEGHIVNTASMAGLIPMPGGGPYNATKHGVVALSEGLYLELKSTGSPVEVSVLCPGWVKTRIMEPNQVGGDNPMTALMSEYARTAVETTGIDPADVATQVVDAVKEERFWILTHPETRQIPVQRMQRAALGENPALSAI